MMTVPSTAAVGRGKSNCLIKHDSSIRASSSSEIDWNSDCTIRPSIGGLVVTAVSFASPEKHDSIGSTLDAMDNISSFNKNDNCPYTVNLHPSSVASVDGTTSHIKLEDSSGTAKSRSFVSKRGGRSGTPSPSTFVPPTPSVEVVEIASHTLLLNQSEGDDTSHSLTVRPGSPLRALSLQPRKFSVRNPSNDTETVPSLCSSTSGLHCESSPDSERLCIGSTIKNESDVMVDPESNSAAGNNAIKILDASPFMQRDEGKRSDRNVTFSPVPPVKYCYTDERSGRTLNRQTSENHSNRVVAPPFPSSMQEYDHKDTYKSAPNDENVDCDKRNDDEVEHNRSGGVTPTNFALDYGKIDLSSSSFEGFHGFSWLQSPPANALFSPGGLAVSTPTLSVLFFPDGPSHLPSPHPPVSCDSVVEKESKVDNVLSHPYGNVICVSPLASTKRSTSVTSQSDKQQLKLNSIDFKEVFASPKPYCESATLTLKSDGMVSGDNSQTKEFSDLDFDMAERDIMEDEDLNLLRNLAQSTTPRSNSSSDKASGSSVKFGGKANVFRNTTRARPLCHPWNNSPSVSNVAPIRTESRDQQIRSSSRNDSYLSHHESFGTCSHGSQSIATVMPPRRCPSKNSSMEYKAVSVPLANDGMTKISRKVKRHAMQTSKISATSNSSESNIQRLKPGSSPAAPSLPKGYYPPPYAKPAGITQHVHASPYPHHHPGIPPPPYRYTYPPRPAHSYGLFPSNPSIAVNLPQPPSSEECNLNLDGKRTLTVRNNPSKKLKKTSPKPKISPGLAETKKGSKLSPEASVTNSSPGDRQKSAAVLSALNLASGNKNDKAAALAAAIMRGVTMRPSGKWQAQLYYAGKSRYIGVFDTREKAALAYEIAREKLKTDKPIEPGSISLKETEANVNAARKAAFDGVNDSETNFVTEK